MNLIFRNWNRYSLLNQNKLRNFNIISIFKQYNTDKNSGLLIINNSTKRQISNEVKKEPNDFEVKLKESKENFNPEKTKFTRSGLSSILRLKDLFDYIIYGIFGFAIYYAYQQYKKKNEYKKEIEAEEITVEKFKKSLFKVKDFVFPDFIVNILKQIKSFETRKDDVWVCSFPKSGTTWVQEIVYLIMNDCDFEKSKSISIEERSPFLEFPYPGIKYINNISSPRIIKTHMPIEFLPDNLESKSKVRKLISFIIDDQNSFNFCMKLIYVVRNPKDVAVSYHYFIKMLTEAKYDGEINDSLNNFIEGKVPYGPWWKHVDDYVKKKNIFLIHYEDLFKKPVEVVKELGIFLGKELTDEKIHSIIEWCSFENMKNNPSVNYEWNKALGLFKKEGEFFRKGKIGDWLNHFSHMQSSKFDQVINENLSYNTKLDYGINDEDLKKIYSQANLVELKKNKI